MILRHQSECEKVAGSCVAFFLAPIPNAKPNSAILKNVPVGKNTFGRWFRNIIDACDVTGVGFRIRPTLHSLRATMISKLQRMGHTDSQIAQRTGHKSINSLKSYTTTLGQEGHLQQSHIFNVTQKHKKMKIEKSNYTSTDKSVMTSTGFPIGSINAQNVTINYYCSNSDTAK